MIYTPNYCLKLGTCYLSLCIDACILFSLDQFSGHPWWLTALALVDIVILLSAAVGSVFLLRLLLLPVVISRFLLLFLLTSLFSLTAIGAPVSFSFQQRIADCPVAVIAIFFFDLLVIVELVFFFKIWKALTTSQKEDQQPALESPPPPPHYLKFEEQSTNPTDSSRNFVQNMLTFSDPRGIPIWLF